MSKVTITTIDAILPQTQCGLCSYGACLPYATALVEANAPINLCPPGGVETLEKLGQLLNQDPTPFREDMQVKTKFPTRAFIREEECIGCTKCLQVCPVDAIIGATKQMHTIISDECTGCDLCLAPCPMDCIEMIPITFEDSTTVKMQANRARQRYHSRQERLAQPAGDENTLVNNPQTTNHPPALDVRKTAIAAAVARANAKRQLKNQPE
jgi:Na+-translocating ferredoxin:NAD+ oxidoreductase subunit B